MVGEQGWANVSFTPAGEPAVLFGEAEVTFPGRQDIDLEDMAGLILIRVQSSNIAMIPTFPKGQKGTFQGTRPQDGIIYTASNATVTDSKPGDLTLASVSADGVTSPISTSVRWVPFDLTISSELDESLRELAKQTNRTVEDVLVRAVALYRFLSDQALAGKRVGVAKEGQDLETEIKGF